MNNSKIINDEAFPELKHIVLLGDSKHPSMFNFYEDIFNPAASLPLTDMLAREQTLSFEDVVNIQFTSGTTGYPKGVTLTHHGILNNALYVGEALQCTPYDKLAINVPLYHTIGMVLGNLVALQYGSTMVYPSGSFDPTATL